MTKSKKTEPVQPQDAGPEYQGWPNRETWAVNLWLSNDRGDYEQWSGRASELLDTARPRADGILAMEMEDAHDAFCDQDEIGDAIHESLRDLFTAARARINWRHIAGTWLDEAHETARKS